MATEAPIEFMEPRKKGYTVYAKTGCQYCTQVKSLLKTVEFFIIDCDPYLVANREPFLEWMRNLAGKEVKTFPMVFHNGKFLGGFRETQEYYDTLDAFSYIDNF